MSKKKKKPLKKLTEKIQKGTKKLKDKTGKAPFLVLVPYKGIMKRKLKQKGISAPDDIKELTIKFYNEFVRKRNFDEYGMEIPHTDVNVNHATPIPPEAAAQLIPAVIEMLKNIIKSIKSGKETDPELREAADTAEKEIEKMEKESKEKKEDSGSPKWIVTVIAGVVVLALVMFFVRK